MGLLDLPAPLFAWTDGVLDGIAPATLRLILWGIVAGAASMALYWALSPQGRIAAVKAKAAEARRTLDAYEGEFGDAWPLIRRMLGLSFRQLGLVTWPAVVASLPVLCLIAWLSTAYGHAFPAPGTVVDVDAVPDRLQARWVDGSGQAASPVPGEAPHIVVADGGGQVVGDIALSAPVPTLHKREWWNVLIGNPAGYLPDEDELERIDIGLPRREFLAFGPSWLRGWETVFFTALLACSIAIKVGFRVE
jgi:hypothetical protein